MVSVGLMGPRKTQVWPDDVRDRKFTGMIVEVNSESLLPIVSKE